MPAKTPRVIRAFYTVPGVPAGDTHIYAVVSLDGRTLGTGKPGPVMTRVKQMLEADAEEGEAADHEIL